MVLCNVILNTALMRTPLYDTQQTPRTWHKITYTAELLKKRSVYKNNIYRTF
jgi:hypothetical protein